MSTIEPFYGIQFKLRFGHSSSPTTTKNLKCLLETLLEYYNNYYYCHSRMYYYFYLKLFHKFLLHYFFMASYNHIFNFVDRMFTQIYSEREKTFSIFLFGYKVLWAEKSVLIQHLTVMLLLIIFLELQTHKGNYHGNSF